MYVSSLLCSLSPSWHLTVSHVCVSVCVCEVRARRGDPGAGQLALQPPGRQEPARRGRGSHRAGTSPSSPDAVCVCMYVCMCACSWRFTPARPGCADWLRSSRGTSISASRPATLRWFGHTLIYITCMHTCVVGMLRRWNLCWVVHVDVRLCLWMQGLRAAAARLQGLLPFRGGARGPPRPAPGPGPGPGPGPAGERHSSAADSFSTSSARPWQSESRAAMSVPDSDREPDPEPDCALDFHPGTTS